MKWNNKPEMKLSSAGFVTEKFCEYFSWFMVHVQTRIFWTISSTSWHFKPRFVRFQVIWSGHPNKRLRVPDLGNKTRLFSPFHTTDNSERLVFKRDGCSYSPRLHSSIFSNIRIFDCLQINVSYYQWIMYSMEGLVLNLTFSHKFKSFTFWLP